MYISEKYYCIYSRKIKFRIFLSPSVNKRMRILLTMNGKKEIDDERVHSRLEAQRNLVPLLKGSSGVY